MSATYRLRIFHAITALVAVAGTISALGQQRAEQSQRVTPPAVNPEALKQAPATQQQAVAPTVMSVEPNRLLPGQTYTLNLSGIGLQGTMQLDFGPGILVKGQIAVPDTAHARVTVQVEAGTPAARHLVTTIWTRPATLAALPAIKTSGPGYVDVTAPAATGPVILRQILPAQVQQGQQVTLTLQGSGFVPGMAVSFGPGITASGTVQVANAERATVAISVAPQAPTFERHPTVLMPGHDVIVSKEVTLTVVAQAGPGPTKPTPVVAPSFPTLPVVLAVSPARLFAGQSYTLTLRGVNLVPQMQLDLGAGIKASSGLRVQSASLATLDVEVSSEASPGTRWIGLQLPQALAPLREDASLLVQRAPVIGGIFKPRPQCNAPKPSHPGTVVLDSPLYTGTVSDVGATVNVPVLNNETDLTWHEANPGLAQRFEVRFYHGSTMVASRSLTARPGYALPHDLPVDPSLVAELTSKVSARAGKEVSQHPSSIPSFGWDLTWQVVGLKTYNAECPGQAKELEVEHSEPVPIKQPNNGDPLLDLPAAPTGMACGGAVTPAPLPRLRAGEGRSGGSHGGVSPSANSTLGAVNTSRGSGKAGVATADHVGDVWQLQGGFDLSNSPWAIQTQTSVNTSGKQYPVEGATLNNVFLDWGDGHVVPLTIQWRGQYCGNQPCFASNTETSNPLGFSLDQANNPTAFQHVYMQVGSYTLRVYALPSSQSGSALPASIKAGSGGLYGHLVSQAGQMPQNFGNAGSDAYLLACQPITIQHHDDPVSTEPLQLVNIRVQGFPGETSAGGEKLKRLALTPGPSPTLRAGEGRKLAPIEVGKGPQVPQFCSCDVSLIGGAALDYYGQGTVRLTWYQDGVPVGSSDEPIGPSPPRTDQQLAPPQAKPNRGTASNLNSPALSLAQAKMGPHELQVAAEVVQDAKPIGRALGLLGNVAAGIKGAGGLPQGAPPLGVLAPKGAGAAGLPLVLWAGERPAGAIGAGLHLEAGGSGPHPLPSPAFGGRGAIGSQGSDVVPENQPPNQVTSAPAPYEITSADPNLPCTFDFPVQGGKFVIGGLQHGGKATIQSQGGHISGTGTLQFHLADASGAGTQLLQVPVHLQNWTLTPDGKTVASGSFHEAPGLTPIPAPGLSASLDKLDGTAGQQVTATLSLSLANPDIYGLDGNRPSAWKGVAQTLTPQGDWYAANLPIPPLLLYDGGFSLSAASATLDLSQGQGGGADLSCRGGSGNGWMGVLLNQPRVTAFNFDLPNPPVQAAPGWALDGYGFCGQANFPAGSAVLDRGSIGWSGIAVSASLGKFSAGYSNLKVHVPWLNVDMTAAQAVTQLTAGRGASGGAIKLNLTSPTSVKLTEGPITLTANHLNFTSMQGIGWAVSSDTTVDFAAQTGQFAKGLVLNGFDYGMNGAGYFDGGSTTRHIGLAGQKGTISGGVVDLKSVDVQAGPPSSATRLSFAFDTTLTLSKTLPAADVPVTYSINEQPQGQYAGAGPVTAPFKLQKPFPDANPSIQLNMTPKYVATGSGSKGNSGIVFSSNLDLAMFGGPPVSGQFVLGYVGNDDYWLAKAILDLGPTGTPVAPPFINLYQVGGGMGYNVTLDSFKNSDLTKATPSDDSTLLFDAALLVGSPDHSTFGLTGDFVIKPGGQDPGGRMDYHAWLLNPSWTGQSPFYGYFSFSGGTFDGTLNAQLSLLDNQVALNATHDAIHLHAGGGQWYFHLGTQANPIDGHVFFADGKAWADVGSDGFMLGLIARLDLDAGDCGSACAYIHDDWLLTAGITPSPLAFSAQASESFNLGACVASICLGANASAGVALSLPPPYLDFTFSLGSCPPGHIDVGLQVLPSLNPSVGGGACL